MGKKLFLLSFSLFICFTVSAQFWKKTPQPRLPLLTSANTNTFNYTKSNPIQLTKLTPPVTFGRMRYSYDVEEAAIMKELYHTLRFRMYTEAIDAMNRLVNLYIAESRYSEAKWYL